MSLVIMEEVVFSSMKSTMLFVFVVLNLLETSVKVSQSCVLYRRNLNLDLLLKYKQIVGHFYTILSIYHCNSWDCLQICTF